MMQMDNNDFLRRLNSWADECHTDFPNAFGYPANYNINLTEFYRWYLENGLGTKLLNNAGDPFEAPNNLSTLSFEREVIEYFAPKYGFSTDDLWGMVTMSGTDGNNHGIYFGVNYLRKTTGKEPILYFSDEAHYSNYRLCHLQNLEVRLVKTDSMGRMLESSLAEQLEPSRPCLMVYAMGSTFKGAIDDQPSLNKVLARYPNMPVYRHLDAALFGGYLPFSRFRSMVNRNTIPFDSISISGHKFFGIDSPCGMFITTRKIYDTQASFEIPYLNSDMRMISCSRAGMEPLKFWWLIQTVGEEKWTRQAEMILENTEYFKRELSRIGWPHWANSCSNTIFLRRPPKEIVEKYTLANSYDDAFGGELSHIVVMQHVTKEAIDCFIRDLSSL